MVRTVQLSGFANARSCIGFGCASLGSRISAAHGERMLARGYEQGVTWYDVAPPYGAGQAEDILGRFLKGRRDKVSVCTKVGLAPPSHNGIMRAVYAAGRPLVGALRQARRSFRKVSATRNVKLPLTAELISQSVARSLAKLGTDHVDVLALHDPAPDDVIRDDIVRALEAVIARGQARHIAVAGSLPACLAAAGRGMPYTLLQTAEDLRASPVAVLHDKAAHSIAAVSHSVLGVDGALDALAGKLSHRADAKRLLAEHGYDGPFETALARLLIDRALALNSDGVVLLSMFSERHLDSNIKQASQPISNAAIELSSRLVAQADGVSMV